MKILVFIFIISAILCISCFTSARQAKPHDDGRRYLSMRMPNVHTFGKEIYLCTAFPTLVTDFEYIVKFTPNVTMHTPHHIAIYGCDAPGVLEKDIPSLVWECAHTNSNSSEHIQGPICKSNQNSIYAWAKNAPGLELPEGVGFKIGKGTGINYLILQIHYVDKFIRDDVSGVTLTLLPSHTDKVSKIAGDYLLGSGGIIIRAGEEEHFEAACRIEELKTIHPFAFKTHTHGLGKVVSGYKIDKDGKWHLIGKHNPQEPQMYYPVNDKNLVITYGDILAARCTFYNFKDHDVYHGKYNSDEMCVFRMMYYVDEDRPLQNNKCYTDGPKLYYWNTDSKIKFVPNDINLSASTLN